MIDHEAEATHPVSDSLTAADAALAASRLRELVASTDGPMAVRAAEIILKESKTSSVHAKMRISKEELDALGGAFLESRDVFRAAHEEGSMGSSSETGCPESLLPL